MLTIKPSYIIEGCPIEVSFKTQKNRRVLCFYGIKPILTSSAERLVFQAQRKKSKVVVFYWENFFFKREKKTFKVNLFKSSNIEDINHELNIPIRPKKQSIYTSGSKLRKLMLKEPESFVNTQFNKPILNIDNQIYTKKESTKIKLNKSKTLFLKNSLDLKISRITVNESFELFKQELIDNENI